MQKQRFLDRVQNKPKRKVVEVVHEDTQSGDSSDSEVMPRKKIKKSEDNTRHDYSSWHFVFQSEQQKNKRRIDEVSKSYKQSLINELAAKQNRYSQVMNIRSLLSRKSSSNLKRPDIQILTQGQGGVAADSETEMRF